MLSGKATDGPGASWVRGYQVRLGDSFAITVSVRNLTVPVGNLKYVIFMSLLVYLCNSYFGN